MDKGPRGGALRVFVACVAAFLVATILAGCSANPAAPPNRSRTEPGTTIGEGTHERRIAVDGVARTFRIYRPRELSSPAALVVMLHGGFGSGSQAESSYGWNAQADRGHFLVAYPDGLNRAWNTGGGCCGRPATDDVDDVGFITEMIASIRRQTPIDERRIYASGMSNGGMMTYTLACRTDLFAAIGPVSATLLGACPSPRPLSVIHIHGAADESIRYDGGPGQGVAHIDGPAIAEVNAFWRQVNGCAAPQLHTAGVVSTSVASCPGNRTVELITIAGAGHQWPGASSQSAIQRLLGTDPPSTALDATQTIWRFFTAHPK